ncbi:unnamed protein product [Allacma fusca]|uniref:CRAL-TRIO domain-containing protein n=1 Tax=Allacma fusca TaxID=39272 RepID=A0A8J2PDM9_9HEXA|nr:unnamed protein product [Allacma fusca]
MAPVGCIEDALTEEEVAINKLREIIPDIISEDRKFDDDCYLFFWLRASQLVPQDAERMIRKSIQWRKEINVESIDDAVFQEFKQIYAPTWGTLTNGHLVSYNHIGTLDFKKGIVIYGKKMWTQLWSKTFMEMENKVIAHHKLKSISRNRFNRDCVFSYFDVQNVKNFSVSQLMNVDVIRAAHDNVKNLMAYFPAVPEISVMINVNTVFKTIFKVVKPFVDKPHISYEFFGTDEAQWKERLLQVMDKEQIQKFLETSNLRHSSQGTRPVCRILCCNNSNYIRFDNSQEILVFNTVHILMNYSTQSEMAQNIDDGPDAVEIALKTLRENIPDVISEDGKFDDDLYLLQWLKVNKLDPPSTAEMIKKAVEWRREMDIESLNEEEFQEFRRVYAAIWGTTRDGRLIVYNPLGKKDLKKGIATYGKPLWMRLWTRLFLEMEARMIAFNKAKNISSQRITVDTPSCVVNVQDLSNFSALQVASIDVIKTGRENVKNLSTYFPLVINLSMMINMNNISKTIFKVVKPFLSKPYFTYEMFGTDESEWRERLLQIVDEEQLQTFLEAS